MLRSIACDASVWRGGKSPWTGTRELCGPRTAPRRSVLDNTPCPAVPPARRRTDRPLAGNAPQEAHASGGWSRRTSRVARCGAFRAGRCGVRHRKQDFNADAGRCTQNTQMGLSPAWSFTALNAAPYPGEPRRCGGPCPICVFCVHLPASALKPCLLRRAPHTAVTDPGPGAPARTPAPIQAASAARHDSQEQAEPHAPWPVARPALPTVSPGAK